MLKIACVLVLLSLVGCSPLKEGNKQTIDPNTKVVTIPDYRISGDYYRSALDTQEGFKSSVARGLVVTNLNSRTDLDEFELGLMRVSQSAFPTDKYYFREGQYLDRKTISSWLARKYSPEQLVEKKLKDTQNFGLNPINTGDPKASPEYLAHILEQDYMVIEDGNTLKLGGITIGLALNSPAYIQGAASSTDIAETASDRTVLLSEGKLIADEVLTRLRQVEGLENVPITIALFKQSPLGSVIPGNFIAVTNVNAGGNSITDWQEVHEQFYIFPSKSASENANTLDDQNLFNEFKKNIENFFPNFNGVIGRASYSNDKLQELMITIPMQFYGKTEVISFTQYVTSQLINFFPETMSVHISITSSNGPEALIVRNAGDTQPFVYVYH